MWSPPYALAAEAPLVVDGLTLRIEDVVAVARFARPVAFAAPARHRVACCRKMVEVLVEQNEKVYGLTTGFGKLRDVAIDQKDLARLQENLIMSHSCGVGRPFSEEVVRAAILLRANTLCRGNSGVRVEILDQLLNLLNDGVYPYVPEKGSVGASGDLAPLSHLGLVLIGHPEGRFLPRGRRDAAGASPASPDESDFAPMPAPGELEAVARREGWTFRPLALEAKEGLAVNNGTQFMTAVTALAAYDAHFALRFAELAGALSLEAQRGVRNAYDPRLHAARPLAFQAATAARVIAYCAGSQILDLYLNTAHLHQARRHLLEAAEFLEAASRELEAGGAETPPTVRNTLAEARALGGELIRVIPTGSDGRIVEQTIAAWSRLPPREQIRLFYGLLRPLRERASDLLRTVDQEAFPETTVGDKVRSALVAAIRQLDEAVPTGPLVQDDYSFRCFPQVLACAWRALDHVAEIVAVEINSANDNPLLFPPEPEGGLAAVTPEAYAAWLRAGAAQLQRCREGVVGGGNFHGEPIAVAADYLAIALAEVASIAERRIAHLVDENHSRGLPSFLIESSGLNSGFMLPQYTAAALVSENKVLCHPASVDSIPTCANTEDHVSMGTIAARKAAQVLDNVLEVLAIEILTAYQGLKYRLPLEPGVPLRRVVGALAEGGVARYQDDRVPAGDFRAIRRLMRGPALLALLA